MALSRKNLGSVGALQKPIRNGVNISGLMGYYSSNCPYINLIRAGFVPWSPTTWTNAQGWLTNLPYNSSSRIYVNPYGVSLSGYVKPGRYVVTWPGVATITLSSSVATNITPTANRITYDLPVLDAGNVNSYTVRLDVANYGTPGVDINVNDIAVYHIDDEAAHLAGEIFLPEFLNSLVGFDVLRFVDWFDIDNDNAGLNFTNYSDMKTEAHASWYPTPVSVVGKLLAKTNKHAFINTPSKFTAAALDSLFQELYTYIGTGEQQLYIEYSNETWNPSFTQRAWILANRVSGDTVIGGGPVVNTSNNQTGLTVNDRLACATAHWAMQSWKSAEAAFPRNRIIRVLASQQGTSYGGAWEYADTTNALFSGSQLKAVVDAYAIAPYFNFVGNPQAYGLPDLSRKEMVTRNDGIKPGAYWDRVVRATLDYTAGSLIAPSKALAVAKKADIRLITYEAGQHLSETLGYTSNWTATVISNELDFGAVDMSLVFTNGEKMVCSYDAVVNPLTGVTGLFPAAVLNESFWRGYLVKIGTTNSKLKVFANQTDYDSNTPVTLNTATPFGVVPTGVWFIDNYTRLVAIIEGYYNRLESAQGVEWYRQYHEIVKSLGFETFMQYHSAAGWGLGGQGNRTWIHWGLKRSHYNPDADNPRAAWFRRFTNGT